MAKVLMPIPSRDFDPTEVAVSWAVLTGLGHAIVFATPDGRPGEADDIMLSGAGLDPWSRVPGLRALVVFGRLLGANADARRAYARLRTDAAFRSPIRWEAANTRDVDGVILPGGHRARGMRDYLESPILQALVARFFAEGKPVGAVCHGVLLAARSHGMDGRSVLFGRKTTALTWSLERAAWKLGRVLRSWDPDYYRTYPDGAGQPEGYMAVQQEVTRVLADPADFRDASPDKPDYAAKTGGTKRDTLDNARPAFVVRDGRYVSARWPGDVHTFAKTFAGVLAEAEAARDSKQREVADGLR